MGLLDDFRTFLSSPEAIEVPAVSPSKYLKEQDPTSKAKAAIPSQKAGRIVSQRAPSSSLQSGSTRSGDIASSPGEPPIVPATLINQYNREQLYRQVWSASLKEAADHHGVSEQTLKTVCRRLYIPVPGRGYWKKKHVGRVTGEWPPLPEVRITPAAQPAAWTSSGTEPVVVSGRLLERFNREQLYEDVWKIPKCQLASKWGISEHTLGEVCRKLCIPVPDLGYWLRPAERRTASPPPLPPVQADPRYLIRKRLSEADQSLNPETTAESAFDKQESAHNSRFPEDGQPRLGESSSLPISQVLGSVASDAQSDIIEHNETDDHGSEAVAPSLGTVAEVDVNRAKESCTPGEEVTPFHRSSDSAGRVRKDYDEAEAADVPLPSEPPNGDTAKRDASGNGLPAPEASERVLLVPASLASRYDRQELYDRVWSVPMWTLHKEYRVSDVALAKTCKRLHVPVPGRGYWAMLAAGKPTRPRPPLPSVEVVERLAPKRKNHHHSPEEALAVIKRIRAAVEIGKSIREACGEANISEDTYRRWLLSSGPA